MKIDISERYIPKRKKRQDHSDKLPYIDCIRICFAVIDSVIMQLNELFESIKNIAEQFHFLTTEALH